MSERMYAIRLNAPNDFEYTLVPVPQAGPWEALCRVESVAICGTDPHIIAGDYPGFWPKEFPGNRANPNTLEKAIALAAFNSFDIDSMVTYENGF